MFKFYEVGGKVRDELMGLQSKDIDYVAVPDASLIYSRMEVGTLFKTLVDKLYKDGYEIFLITEKCFTVRAKFPKGHKHEGIVADFVMARRETGYKPGTRDPIVVAGNLYDDLIRRDFTVNAIAKDDDGSYIDPFNGMQALKDKVLITPLSATQSLDDDPLRILRAVRFCITKGFLMQDVLWSQIKLYDYENKMSVVSEERIREELYKCFKHDSFKTMQLLSVTFKSLGDYIFKNTNLWLKPTNEK